MSRPFRPPWPLDPLLRTPDAAPGGLPAPLLEQARAWEAQALRALDPNFEGVLMARAGATVAAWAQALAPDARRVLVACGPGGNGGDGLHAAAGLKRRGVPEVQVLWWGVAERADAGIRAGLQACADAGVAVHAPEVLRAPPAGWHVPFDVAIDALLGLGSRPLRPEDPMAAALPWLHGAPLCLAVDLPSGVHPDTGAVATGALAVQAHHTLMLLAIKPGLLGLPGRQRAGQLWWDTLGTAEAPSADAAAADAPASDAGDSATRTAKSTPGRPLAEAPRATAAAPVLLHPPAAWRLMTAAAAAQGGPQPGPKAHKGDRGEVWAVGGATGMSGALALAADAAVAAGAGRIWAVPLGDAQPAFATPQVMTATLAPLRQRIAAQPWHSNEAGPSAGAGKARWPAALVVGCGGGSAIAECLPELMDAAAVLVLDADALNALAQQASAPRALARRFEQGWPTVLTPHPLEAARLLRCSIHDIQKDRMAAARALADWGHCTVVLKGAGTLVSTWDGHDDGRARGGWLLPTGNARLATGGTGDVLAGWMAGRLAQLWAGGLLASDTAAWARAVAAAAWWHGRAAEATASGAPTDADDVGPTVWLPRYLQQLRRLTA